MLHRPQRSARHAVALTLAAALTSAVAATIDISKLAGEGTSTSTVPATPAPPPSFLRVSGEEGSNVALEIASHRFTSESGGPTINLVGVVHIGDDAYYKAVQGELETADIVLYESVKPEGTGGPPVGGADESDVAKRDRSMAALRFVGTYVERYRMIHGTYPRDLAALREQARVDGARNADFLDMALVDAWGEPVVYALLAGPDGTLSSYRLVSYGADGTPGGEGVAGDQEVDDLSGLPALDGGGSDDNIQMQLASALGLAFQLDAIDYERPNWRCSDMSIDQVQRAMLERGSDFTVMEGALAGTTLPARVAKLFLGLMRLADVFMDGAISDSLKVLLIEMLGDERMVETSLESFDPAFAEVIIGERNQVVVDDLKRLLETEDDVDQVAVFYGAGHMADLTRRLDEQLGYTPSGDATWRPAILVDLDASAVSPQEVAYLRRMMRQMMHGMQRPAGR